MARKTEKGGKLRALLYMMSVESFSFEYSSVNWAYYVLNLYDWGAFLYLYTQKCSPFFIDCWGALWYNNNKNCSPKRRTGNGSTI